jgi:hypothetical protein
MRSWREFDRPLLVVSIKQMDSPKSRLEFGSSPKKECPLCKKFSAPPVPVIEKQCHVAAGGWGHAFK